MEGGAKEGLPNGQMVVPFTEMGNSGRGPALGGENHKSSFRHIEFEVPLRMYIQLSKVSIEICNRNTNS